MAGRKCGADLALGSTQGGAFMRPMRSRIGGRGGKAFDGRASRRDSRDQLRSDRPGVAPLGVAFRSLPKNASEFDAGVEQELIFLGLMGMQAKIAVARAKGAGIRPILQNEANFSQSLQWLVKSSSEFADN
jgi:hypothetical protein